MCSSAIIARIRNSSTGLCGASVSSTEISVTKPSRPFFASNVPINPARLLHGEQEFGGGPVYGFFGEVERPFDSRNGERAGVAAHGLQEDADCVGLGRFAGEIRYVQGKKVASRE